MWSKEQVCTQTRLVFFTKDFLIASDNKKDPNFLFWYSSKIPKYAISVSLFSGWKINSKNPTRSSLCFKTNELTFLEEA